MCRIQMILMLSLQAQRQSLLSMGWCGNVTKCETNAQKLGKQRNFLFESVWNRENVSQDLIICFISSQNKNYSRFYISSMHLHSSSIIKQENKFQCDIPSYLLFFIFLFPVLVANDSMLKFSENFKQNIKHRNETCEKKKSVIILIIKDCILLCFFFLNRK